MTAVVGDVGEGLYSVFPSGAGNTSTFTVDTFIPGHNMSNGVVSATVT